MTQTTSCFLLQQLHWHPIARWACCLQKAYEGKQAGDIILPVPLGTGLVIHVTHLTKCSPPSWCSLACHQELQPALGGSQQWSQVQRTCSLQPWTACCATKARKHLWSRKGQQHLLSKSSHTVRETCKQAISCDFCVIPHTTSHVFGMRASR